MPVITFLNDIFCRSKGAYYAKIGIHTQKFCQRAAEFACNENQRRCLLVAIAAVDDMASCLLGLGPAAKAAGIAPRKGVNSAKPAMLSAMKGYASALLVLSGSRRTELLAVLGLAEPEFVLLWRRVFDYGAEDAALFNHLLQGVQTGGMDELTGIVAAHMTAALKLAPAIAPDWLQNTLLDDFAALLRKTEGE